MPPGFGFAAAQADLWMPEQWSPEYMANRDQYYLQIIARLRPGQTVERFSAELETVATRLRTDHAEYNTDLHLNATSLQETIVSGVRPRLLMVGFSSRVWRAAPRSNGSVLTDLPFQLTWETSRLQQGRAGILTNFTGGAHGVELGQGTAAEQAARMVADLERVFPGVTAARAGMKEVRFHWPSFQWTHGSYASYLTGQRTAFRGLEGGGSGWSPLRR